MSKAVAIQNEIKGKIEAGAFFDTVPVIQEDVADIETEIEIGIGKIGVVIIVMTPALNQSSRFAVAGGAYWDRIEVVIQIVESPTINRASSGTGKPAVALAEAISTLLTLSTLATCNAPLTPLDPTLSIVPDPDFVIWNCRFRTGAGDRDALHGSLRFTGRRDDRQGEGLLVRLARFGRGQRGDRVVSRGLH